MNFFGLWYRVYQKTIKPGIAPDIPDLTFIYTSFAKIFCQNKIKKNRKFVLRFAIKNSDIRLYARQDKYIIVMAASIYYCYIIYLLLCILSLLLLYNQFIVISLSVYYCYIVSLLLCQCEFVTA